MNIITDPWLLALGLAICGYWMWGRMKERD